jgi:alkanesulfonate monooxygenase SsuD/methylene tetrahydromethanopterin reductase-like flavin-dependent oxidoreductase (luciferase family)
MRAMGERRIRLGLLEFGELPLPEIVQTAQLAERLGFSRYWLAEHIGPLQNTLLATPVVAGATSRIRVGPAGVLLRYYAAACVARDGIFLAQAFPGRIDLGLAGGRHGEGMDLPFLDGRTHLYAPETLEEKIRVVAETLAAPEPASRGHERRRPEPASELVAERPELWLLGSSDSPWRARSAALVQANFCLSLLHKPAPPSPLAIRAYRKERRRLGLAPGIAGIAIALACVESAREQKRHRTPHTGIFAKTIVETAAVCRERIEALCREYDVREVSILESSAGPERRWASMQMLAEAFGGLEPLAPEPPSGRRGSRLERAALVPPEAVRPARSKSRAGTGGARGPTSGPRR